MVRRRAPGAFAKNTIDLLKTFAAQSVLAIQNARLFHEIEDKSRQLEIASKHKSQFLANMSHELRTPLNAILGYTELILDNIYGEAPEKMRAVLERVQSNGKHLLGLINDVLDLSKIEAGQLTLVARPTIRLRTSCTACSARSKRWRAEKDLRFKVELPPDLPIGARRRAAPHPGAAQPRRQCDQVHRPGRGRDQGLGRQRLVHRRGARHRPRHFSSRSSEDLRGVPAGRHVLDHARRAAPGSACRSPSASSRCTAGGSGSSRPWPGFDIFLYASDQVEQQARQP